MKLLVHGFMEEGQHTLQRTDALAAVPGVEVVRSPVRLAVKGRLRQLVGRVTYRLRWPTDMFGENRQLLELARRTRPDAVLVENRPLLRAGTLKRIRRETGARLAYLCPDDVMARHNLTGWLKRSFRLWDHFFTTKTFNVDELRREGVRDPVLIGNIYTPSVHRPLGPEEVGTEYEAFDLVFIGVYERDRAESLRKLAEAGFSIVVYGPDAGAIHGRWSVLDGSGIVLRPAVWGEDYIKALHHGKLVLGFLRKHNRDLITQRSIEVPAMGRPMLAERTDEHDQHFVDGAEYVGFGSDEEMIEKARALIADPNLRRSIGAAGRRRCLESGYDVDALARLIAQTLSRPGTDAT
jgi:spore maturation protein CgeB